jgi:D-alanyl-D-alanine dipeptidase
LFEQFKQMLRENNSSWSEERLFEETKKLVPLPGDPMAAPVMPHNSGGAVDLTLTYKGLPCDMGTVFDDSTERAAPDFFEKEIGAGIGIEEERYLLVRKNRRFLFHAMTSVGFSIHPYEWWHFNYGNASWAKLANQKEIFGSMEEEFGKFW